MTAINIVLQCDSAHVLTDGAVLDLDDGKVIAIAPKAFALPHLNAVVAFQGTVAGMVLLTEVLSAAATWADLKRNAAAYVREGAAAVSNMKIQHERAMRLFIAGFHENNSEAFAVLSAEADGLPAGELLPIPNTSIAPIDGDLHADVLALVGGRSVDDFDPAVDGLAILEMQRARRWADSKGRVQHTVGGFAQLTSVTKDGITARILKRWDDPIGRPISPAGQKVAA